MHAIFQLLEILRKLTVTKSFDERARGCHLYCVGSSEGSAQDCPVTRTSPGGSQAPSSRLHHSILASSWKHTDIILSCN